MFLNKTRVLFFFSKWSHSSFLRIAWRFSSAEPLRDGDSPRLFFKSGVRGFLQLCFSAMDVVFMSWGEISDAPLRAAGLGNCAS